MCKSFLAIVRDFFSFSTLYPSIKGRRDLEFRRLGWFFMENSIFEVSAMYFFEKNEKLRFRNFRRSTEVGF